MKGWAAEGEYEADIVLAATANSLAAVITCGGVLFSIVLGNQSSISIIGDGQPVFNRFFLCSPFLGPKRHFIAERNWII